MSLGIVCCGQGNQYPEMFKKLNDYNPKLVEDLSAKLGLVLIPQIRLSTEDFYSNVYAQPLIAAYEYLLWQEISKNINVPPVVMSGYSLGEISAFSCSSKLDLDTLITITKKRAQLMSNNESPKSGLVAITGLNSLKLSEICEKYKCHIAIENDLEMFIIGGLTTDLDNCINNINNLGLSVKITRLNVSVASHTPLLSSASVSFTKYLEPYKMLPLDTKIISGISANINYTSSTLIPDLGKQLQSTILFDKVINVMYEAGATMILEIGPGNNIAGIIKKYNLPIVVKSVDDFSSINGLITWLNKILESN